MKFVNYKASLKNGENISIELNQACKCSIALVAISISNFNERGLFENMIDIYCDQIDSTFDNPSRLLCRIPFNRLEKDLYYQTWTARHLQLEKVDSEDTFLTLNDGKELFCALGL